MVVIAVEVLVVMVAVLKATEEVLLGVALAATAATSYCCYYRYTPYA